MQNVSIGKVTKDNWKKACRISLKPEQQHFLSPVAYCLARAYINPYEQPIEPYVIYKEEEVAGFFWFTLAGRETRCLLCGFRIDKEYQGLGLAKKALAQLLLLLRENYPECASIQLFVETDNTVAKNLYKSFGFTTVQTNDNHLELMLYRLKDNVEIALTGENDLLDE